MRGERLELLRQDVFNISIAWFRLWAPEKAHLKTNLSLWVRHPQSWFPCNRCNEELGILGSHKKHTNKHRWVPMNITQQEYLFCYFTFSKGAIWCIAKPNNCYQNLLLALFFEIVVETKKIEGRDFDKILWRDISRLLLHRMRAAHPAREACTSPIVCLKTWLCLLCLSLLCLPYYLSLSLLYNTFLCSALLCTDLLYSIQFCPDDFFCSSRFFFASLKHFHQTKLSLILFIANDKSSCAPRWGVDEKGSQISKTVRIILGIIVLVPGYHNLFVL